MKSTAPMYSWRGSPLATMLLAAATAAPVAIVTVRLALPQPVVSVGGAPPSDQALLREVADLRRELEQLRFAVQLSAATSTASSPPPGVTPSAAPAPPITPRATAVAAPVLDVTAAPVRRYERFEVPAGAVTVRQGSSGDLVVWNTDPSLAGQVIEVKAWTSDANLHLLRITVPAVDGN